MRKGLRRTLLVVGILAVVAIVARLAAPTAVERYVNRQLDDMGEYHGSVAEIELSLIRGGYVLRNLEILKRDAASDTPPFATIPAMDLHFEWRALFQGSAVGEVVMHEPQLNLVQSEAEPFSADDYGRMVGLAQKGAAELFRLQQDALSRAKP